MRKISLFFIAIIMVIAVNAQTSKNSNKKVSFKQTKTQAVAKTGAKVDIFSEGFEAGMPATWLNIDSDGDTYKWDTSTVFDAHSGVACAKSASWVNSTIGPVTPSNWLITPSITLPASGNLVLEYWVSGQDQLYPAEHYKLLASPTAASDTASFTINLNEETITTGNAADNNYLKRTISLTGYAGTSIRLAWVHFACTDNFYMNLDDIRIFEPLAADAQVVSTTLPAPSCGLTATAPVIIKIRNNGSSAITGFPVSFKKGVSGATITENVAASVAAGADYDYTFTATADFSAVGAVDSVLSWVALTGDLNTANDAAPWAATANVEPAVNPYTMGFEATDDFLGMNIFDNNNDASTWGLYTGAADAHAGLNFLGYKYNSSSAADDWFVTKCITLAPGNYAVTYYYKATGYTESLKVAYGTSNTVASLTNIIATHPAINDTVYQFGVAPFTVTTAGTYYFGFQAYSAADMNYLLIDDITVDLNNKISETNNQFFMNAYPNPAKDQVIVEASAQINSVKVYDIVGNIVANNLYNDQSVKVNTSNLQSGIYFIAVETALGVKTQKINIVR